MLKLAFTIFLVAALVRPGSYGQEAHPRELLEEYFYRAANGQSSSISVSQIKEIPFQQVLLLADPFLKDQNPLLRFKAIDLIKRAGALSENEEERKSAVLLLATACSDKDGGNSGAASSGLLLFRREEFTQQATDSIAVLLEKRCYHFERIIRIAGFLENASTTKILDNLQKNDSTLSAKEAWAVELALARTGNTNSLNSCIDKIRQAPVNDYSVSYLFPDLVYMRQPESVRIVLQEILSDEKKCRSSNPDKEDKITCAFKLIELVAPIIKDFPVKLTSYGEIDTDNYDDTLLLVRDWINHLESLNLIRNIY